ncbi:hypothetical protein Ocin01_13018 [Orchesella cincta]|uniref:Ciliary microtubule inner protein 2A-C-like domain-containing protein n=1 Tax=Orchesella cincta TaxID=48709 RepID=A0A1D2ML13_ORCCI|nr:hypothetical protein Ocin01_13018 [Orchesella cincta]
MECACLPNNGPRMTPEPHMIPGYMGYVPQYKFKFGTTYGQQTNRLYLDPCVNMSPRAVLTDVCPEDCSSGGFLQSATGLRFGQCGCNDPYKCNIEPQYTRGTNRGQTTQTPRFQTIMNHTYAPFCNRFCTKTFEQDQWRDRLFIREKQAMDGWRYCYKAKPWERPERLGPWDGDHAEFRRTQTTIQPPILKDDIDIFLRGYDGICGPSGPRMGESRYKAVSQSGGGGRGGGMSTGAPSGGGAVSTQRRSSGSGCPPCELYQRHMRGTEKAAKDAGLDGIVKHPLYPYVQGNPIRDCFCENIEVLKKLNKEQMSRSPETALDGVIEELGELPILTLHKLQQKLEDKSGLFYPDERGLARVCNPIGDSYLTARPFRCNTIYRYCEPVHPKFAGHVPGEQFIPGENRGKATRNATKYMTYRV